MTYYYTPSRGSEICSIVSVRIALATGFDPANSTPITLHTFLDYVSPFARRREPHSAGHSFHDRAWFHVLIFRHSDARFSNTGSKSIGDPIFGTEETRRWRSIGAAVYYPSKFQPQAQGARLFLPILGAVFTFAPLPSRRFHLQWVLQRGYLLSSPDQWRTASSFPCTPFRLDPGRPVTMHRPYYVDYTTQGDE